MQWTCKITVTFTPPRRLWQWRYVICLSVCLSHSCECNISKMPCRNVFKFSTNVCLDYKGAVYKKSGFLSLIPNSSKSDTWDGGQPVLQSQSVSFWWIGNDLQKFTFLTNCTFKEWLIRILVVKGHCDRTKRRNSKIHALTRTVRRPHISAKARQSPLIPT